MVADNSQSTPHTQKLRTGHARRTKNTKCINFVNAGGIAELVLLTVLAHNRPDDFRDFVDLADYLDFADQTGPKTFFHTRVSYLNDFIIFEVPVEVRQNIKFHLL